MPTLTLSLERFAFPEELDRRRANFRIVFDVKYWARVTNTRHEVRIANALKPGADVFWECDPTRRGRPNYVRAMDGDRALPWIDVTALDPWDRVVLHVEADQIIAVRAKVFDVNRESFFEDVEDVLGGLVSGIFGVGRHHATELAPVGAKDAAGDSIDEIHSYLVKKLTGGGDKVLFQGSGGPDASGRIRIGRAGTTGDGSGRYEIELSVTEWTPAMAFRADRPA